MRHTGVVGKKRSTDYGRFHVLFLQCAQQCAHRIVKICVLGIVEPIASQDVSGKAAVFLTGVIENPPRQKNSSGSQALPGVHLQTCGEVAEWPKAAVC
jgi:hypothetical protein